MESRYRNFLVCLGATMIYDGLSVGIGIKRRRLAIVYSWKVEQKLSDKLINELIRSGLKSVRATRVVAKSLYF